MPQKGSFSKEADDSSVSFITSKKSLEEIEKKINSANKQFMQLKVQIEDEEELDSDKEKSHFQFRYFSLANHISLEMQNQVSMKQL
jgi:hypothetical protein